MRALAAVAFLFAATTLHAATADLEITIDAPQRMDARSKVVEWSVNVRNIGPDAAPDTHVAIDLTAITPLACNETTLSIGTLEPHVTKSINCTANVRADFAGNAIPLGATVTSSATDPNPANNTAAANVARINGPNLGVFLFSSQRAVDPGLPFDLSVTYGNVTPTPATNVVIDVDLPPSVTFVSAPANCAAAAGHVTCRIDRVETSLPNYTFASFPIHLVAPDDLSGSSLVFHATITGSEEDPDLRNNVSDFTVAMFRTFVVSKNEDGGAGSLRAAILAANAACVDAYPCKIAFRLQTRTVDVVTPLPDVTARVISIDGTTQRFAAVFTSNGPNVTIRGNAMSTGDGFRLRGGCDQELTGLAISGFPGDAVVVASNSPSPCYTPVALIHDNWIGVDDFGNFPIPNARGVVLNTNAAVSNNLISGNRRSGIVVNAQATINGNTIGLSADRRFACANGASGIYVTKASPSSDISSNYIAFNHDFGIGIERGTSAVDIHPNSIFSNWQAAIDYGLDGVADEAPVVTSARYDAATNTTTIDITIGEDHSTFGPTIQVYAAEAPFRDGRGEAKYYLGTIRPNPGVKNMTLAAQGDWRGKWASATLTHNSYFGFLRIGPAGEGPDTLSSTTELSRAVLVQ